MAKQGKKDHWELEPQKSSAAQMLTYIASTGATGEKFDGHRGAYDLQVCHVMRK